VQESALRAIMKNKSPILVIMGTGAGKSLFMLPARSVSAGTTVISLQDAKQMKHLASAEEPKRLVFVKPAYKTPAP
jgi:superfamily II DNA helicase RecQ